MKSRLSYSSRRGALALAVLATTSALRAEDLSPPVILQYFESKWSTMEKRAPDVFMAGYGALWTPPPGRALYDDQGGGIGYNIYDRFDMGKAGDPTLYGTEKGYRQLINATHQFNSDVYVDYIHHHVASWDIPEYDGANGYTPPVGAEVHDTRDYPGFELSNAYVGAASFDPNYRNFAGYRDTYPDAPPVNDGNSTQFQYQYRLAHLITIDLTSTRSFVRNPVPGDANNIPQAPSAWAFPSTTIVNGQPGASTILRQANSPTNDNKRFYPDNSLPGITVTDPFNGGGSYTIHPYNLADPSQGDPSSETNVGYMMRYAQWLVNDVGVDGLRIDAARHVPYGADSDPYNPNDINVPALIDRAVFRQSRRTNLDGSQRTTFSFQEVFTGDKGFNHQFVRKDINPNTPSVVGGNRDVLDFPAWFAMRNNLTSDGLTNNWYDIRYASQDSQDDGISNNGSESIRFVINHDDGKGNSSAQNSDYIYLDNVAHAWTLMQPGNAYVYFNSHEFDRTGNTTFFLKDGRGDALGGQYGNIITKLVDIRNSYGRGNFAERWIDGGGFSNIYAFERDRSMIVGLNSALGTVTNFDQRTMFTGFAAGSHLVELTGNADDATVDPNNDIPSTVTVDGGGNITMRIPRNQNTNGVTHGRGYVIYGLQRPQGSLALSNVSQTLAGTPNGNNATDRITSIDVIAANSFNITLNTSAVTLSDGYRDFSADGDRGYVRIDGGLNLNGNSGVDYTTQGDTRYGFENFVTTNSPGYGSGTGNGTYVQTINTANLSEGYHYITARAYRQRSDGGADIYNDFRKVVYIDRLPPSSAIDSLTQSTAGSAQNMNVQTRSLDLTGDNVHVFLDLGAALTDGQILSMVGGGSASTQIDRDLFRKDFTNLTKGTHVLSIVTREISGNYSIIRGTGLQVAGTFGLGFGDLDSNSAVNSSDISQFSTVLQSNNNQYNAGAEANTDGLINLSDTFLLGPRLAALNADASTLSAYNNLIDNSYVTSGTYTVNANHTVFDVTAGTTHVLGGSTLTARSIRGNSLTVESGAAVQLQPQSAGGSTSVAKTLAISGTGQIDLSDGAMIVQFDSNPSPLAAVRQYLINGRGGTDFGNATWQGTGGIASAAAAPGGIGDGINPGDGISFAIGYVENSFLPQLGVGSFTTFGGQPVDGGSLLVRFTRGADCTLDGRVNTDDVTIVGADFGNPGTGEWFLGDFDYDGICDTDDVTVLGAMYDPTAPALSEAQLTAQYGSEFAAAFENGRRLGPSVPEPASSLLIGVGAYATLCRRRRRRQRC